MEPLSWVAEYVAFAVMLGLSVMVGLYFGCVVKQQNTISDYLLGGHHMSVFPIAMSLIASHVSGITLLGVPSEVYTYGTLYLVTSVAYVITLFVTIYVFLPVFYELQLTSVYEYLELRFNTKIRSMCSLIFTVHLILVLPVIIYVPALAFNQVTQLNVHIITSIICTICIFYTTVGGLKAVVWTDTIQSVFTVISSVFVIILGYLQADGIGNIIKANSEGDRIEFFNMDPNPFLRNSFWTITVGTTFLWTSGFSIHPGVVQRFVALPTYGKARMALIYFIVGLSVVKVLTGIIGMLLYAKYKDCDPVSANYITSNRYILPFYVMDVAATFPGLTGLFVSGIISAGLSTMSAQLNTVAGTIYIDFVRKIMSVDASDRTAHIIMKCIVVIVGIICVVLVTVIEKLKGILQMTLSLMGVTSGATLSVFTLGICFPRANSRGAMYGILASLMITAWIVTGAQIAIYNKQLMFVEKDVSTAGCPVNITIMNTTDYSGLYRLNKDVYAGPNVWKVYTVSYLYYNTIGTVVGVVVGLAVSTLSAATPRPVDPKLLAPFVRKFVSSEPAVDIKMAEYRPVPPETERHTGPRQTIRSHMPDGI